MLIARKVITPDRRRTAYIFYNPILRNYQRPDDYPLDNHQPLNQRKDDFEGESDRNIWGKTTNMNHAVIMGGRLIEKLAEDLYSILAGFFCQFSGFG